MGWKGDRIVAGSGEMAEQFRRRVAELDDAGWAAVARAVWALEDAWRAGGPGELGEFLPEPGSPLREVMLVELIKVDLEHRWKRDEPKKVEDYLREWPELAGKLEWLAELVEAEWLTRASVGSPASAEAVWARFPELAGRMDLPVPVAEGVGRDGWQAEGGSNGETADGRLEGTPSGTSTWQVPAPGQRLGRYEIRQLLGQGGMGSVYRALDTRLQREVALKVSHGGPAACEELDERFLTEARAAARVWHPNVCPILDAGRIAGMYFLTMKLVEGQSLAERLRAGKLEVREAAALVEKLARGLQAVHAAGVVHGDIKAANVMLDRSGEPLLMDFGVARPRDPELLRAGRQSLVGTPAYMAPEQASGEAIDARSDVYSLGVVLFQALTGRLPFEGTLPEVLTAIAQGQPPSPRAYRPELDATIEAICLKAMAKSPGDRYGSASELAEALAGYLRGAWPARRRRRPRSYWVWGVAMALGGALMVLAAVGLFKLWPQAPRVAAVGEGWYFPCYDLGGTRFVPLASRRNTGNVPFVRKWSAEGGIALAGDVDGDGKLELVTGDTSAVRIYEGSGKLVAHFPEIGRLDILADVTGDGRPEFLVGLREAGELKLRAFDQRGRIVQTYVFGAGVADTTLKGNAVVDLNGDDRLELLAVVMSSFSKGPRGVAAFDATSGQRLWYYDIGGVPGGSDEGVVTVGDLDGDGKLEIVFGNGSPANGRVGADGSDDASCRVWCVAPSGELVWRTAPFYEGGFVDSYAVLADLDHDGRDEIVALPTSHDIADWKARLGRISLLNPPDGSTRPGYDRDFGGPADVAGIADLNPGGNKEILIVHEDRAVRRFYVRALEASLGLPDWKVFDAGGAGRPKVFAINDINGDGLPEVIVGLPGTLYVLNHELTVQWHWSRPDDPGAPITSVIVSDLDGDGINEIIVASGVSATTRIDVLGVPGPET